MPFFKISYQRHKYHPFFVKCCVWFFTVFLIPVFIGVSDVYPEPVTDTLLKISQKQKIRIGVSIEYPPLHYFKDRKELGLEIDLIMALGKFLGVKTELVPLETDQYISALKNGKVDILVCGLSVSLDRLRQVWFSNPYLVVHPSILIDRRKIPRLKISDDIDRSGFSSFEDLKKVQGFVFAVKEGSVYTSYIEELFPGGEVEKVKTNNDGIGLLQKGKVSGFVHDSVYFQGLLKQNPALGERYLLLVEEQRQEQISIGLPYGDVRLKMVIDQWINEIQRNGTLRLWADDYL